MTLEPQDDVDPWLLGFSIAFLLGVLAISIYLIVTTGS